MSKSIKKLVLFIVVTSLLSTVICSCANHEDSSSPKKESISATLSSENTSTQQDYNNYMFIEKGMQSSFYENDENFGLGELHYNDEWKYIVHRAEDEKYGYISITEYLGEGGNIVIPEEIDGYPVHCLKENIFEYGEPTQDTVTNIEAPDSLSCIYNNQTNNVLSFEYTPWFENQPDGMVYIGNVAYKYKGNGENVKSLTLREGTRGIAPLCFENCPNLEELIMPDSVVRMDLLVFGANEETTPISNLNKSLKKLKLSKNIITIETPIPSTVKDIYIPNSLLYAQSFLSTSIFSELTSANTVYFEGTQDEFEKIIADCTDEISCNIEYNVEFPIEGKTEE